MQKLKSNTILSLIIITLLVVGLFYIFLNNSKRKENNLVNKLPEENQVVNTNTEVGCLPTTVPWIKVVSPNGGETYTAGQQITIRWKSCNNPYTPKQVVVRLSNSKDYYYYLSGNNFDHAYSPDIGSLTATLPLVGSVTSVSGEPRSFVVGKDFKITVIVYPQEMDSIEDSSDNLFTIQKSNKIFPKGDVVDMGPHCFEPVSCKDIKMTKCGGEVGQTISFSYDNGAAVRTCGNGEEPCFCFGRPITAENIANCAPKEWTCGQIL